MRGGAATGGVGFRRGGRRARRAVRVLLLAGLAGTAAATDADAQHVEELSELMRRVGVTSLPGVTPVFTAPEVGGWTRRAEAARDVGAAVEGMLPVLLVPALFRDSDEPPSDTETLREVFFTGPNPRGTLPEFFTEASGGIFTASGDVAPWHRTSVDRLSATGGPDNQLGIGPEFGDYLLEAIAAADRALDFRQFDNDGPDGVPDSGDDDGRVDALSFIFAEVGRSCGGPGVWPHKFRLAPLNNGEPYRSEDVGANGAPIEADGYVIVSARECDGSPVERVAVIAHELGHELGLPDIYHPVVQGSILSEDRRWVVGCFGLMAAGAWGCGPADEFPAFGPTHFSAWSRDRLGWIELTTVGPDLRRAELFLDPVLGSRTGLRIPLDDLGQEFLLLTYRTREGFDEPLPAPGVLVYRENGSAPLRPDPAGPKRYRISLLEADGDSTLLRRHALGGNRGEAEDVFARDGGPVFLSGGSHPGTRRADGTPTPVTIHRLEVADGRARVVLSTSPVPDVLTDGTPFDLLPLQPVEERIPLAGGALPYTVTVEGAGVPAGLTVAAERDELVLGGEIRETGSFSFLATLTDALGATATAGLSLRVATVTFSGEELLELLLQALVDRPGGALSAGQRELLDRDGNGNGAFDACDLRAHLFGGG